MTEATWDDQIKTPTIDWRMSAAFENVPRGDEVLAEVTSLESAVRACLELDQEHRSSALLTPERSIQMVGALIASFSGEAIAGPANQLR